MSEPPTWPVAGPPAERRLPADGGIGRRELRSFGGTLAGGFAVLGAVLLWRGHQGAAAVPALLAGVLLAVSLAEPGRLAGLRHRWMNAARKISRVTNGILLAVVFFLVASPMGVVARWLGWDPLGRNPRSGEGTFWKRRERRDADGREQSGGDRYLRPY